MLQASDTISNNHVITQERNDAPVNQGQSIPHSPPIKKRKWREDDQKNAQVEKLKDQTSPAAISQSTSNLGDDFVIQIQSTPNIPTTESTEGRKNV